MDKEQMLERFYLQDDEGKDMLLEKLIFCQFSDEHDFENYFRLDELNEGELFCLISFLYKQDCFLMLFDIMEKYRERLISYDVSTIKEMEFSEEFIERFKRLDNFENANKSVEN